MTTLVDEIARAIEAETERQRLPGERPMMLSPLARAALQTVAKWLSQPFESMPEELRDAMTLAVARAMRHETDLASEAVCRALASHLEKEMG